MNEYTDNMTTQDFNAYYESHLKQALIDRVFVDATDAETEAWFEAELAQMEQAITKRKKFEYKFGVGLIVLAVSAVVLLIWGLS